MEQWSTLVPLREKPLSVELCGRGGGISFASDAPLHTTPLHAPLLQATKGHLLVFPEITLFV